MHKLHTLLGQHAQLSKLAEQLNAKSHINQFWQSAISPDLSKVSEANRIENTVLYVTAFQSLAASKIKMLQASLLKALENSQNTDPQYKPYKVTSIKVKVQVKSSPRPLPKRVIPISASSAQHISAFADQLADSPLGDVLKRLASKKT
jgi:Dna[CI] antecedent, DciA